MIYLTVGRYAMCRKRNDGTAQSTLSNSKDIQIVVKKTIAGGKNSKTSHYKIKVTDSRHKKRTDIRFLKSFCYLRRDIV